MKQPKMSSMTIREKVALALRYAKLEDDDVDVAVTAFLEAAAEPDEQTGISWHMRPDEATGAMQEAGMGEDGPNCPEPSWRAMCNAAPEFEWGSAIRLLEGKPLRAGVNVEPGALER